MPFGTLKLRPGVDVIETPTYNGAQLTASMLIRFYKGLPQKRGGWLQRSATRIVGYINELHGYATASTVGLLAAGVESNPTMGLFVNVGTTIVDITPTLPPPYINTQSQWALDNFGQVLLANIYTQPMYKWQFGDPVATFVPGSPSIGYLLVVPQVQIVVALGSNVGGVFEPLLVRWSDAGDYTTWTPTATNQAGSYVIPTGSEIVGGYALGLSVLIWTDIGLTSMIYQGLPFVFGFQPIATGCGLYARRAVGAIGTRLMWLAGHGTAGTAETHRPSGFFEMIFGASAPQPIECDVWDIMIDNCEFNTPEKYFMAVNETYNEFELFFPLKTTSAFYIAGSVEWGSIKYNFVDKAWDYTISPQLQRTAWVGVTPVGTPVGADLDGLLQQHEIGMDANGEGMAWSWQTGDFDLAEGEEMVLVDWLLPDFSTNGSTNPPTITLTVGARKSANAVAVTQSMDVTSTTDWTANFALRGRQFFIGASGSDLGTFNRLGAIRYRAAPDGRGP
jgi:hypothetical protein